MKEVTYEFIGNGPGVPGLPHVITNLEAERMGAGSRLQGAIDAGTYVIQRNQSEETAPEKPAVKKKSKKAEESDTIPDQRDEEA